MSLQISLIGGICSNRGVEVDAEAERGVMVGLKIFTPVAKKVIEKYLDTLTPGHNRDRDTYLPLMLPLVLETEYSLVSTPKLCQALTAIDSGLVVLLV